jgi:hypothetical protein
MFLLITIASCTISQMSIEIVVFTDEGQELATTFMEKHFGK